MADNSIGFTAVYDDVDSALADIDALDKLHDVKVVGKYDAAVVDLENRKPHIVKRVDNPRVNVLSELETSRGSSSPARPTSSPTS